MKKESRRNIKNSIAICLVAVTAVSMNNACAKGSPSEFTDKQPNFLIISVDDVSWFEHSVYGTSNVPTPNVDRIANEGIIFNNGYVSAPSCGPSRAAMLAGKHFWQLEQAAFMQCFFPKKFPTYPQILQANGYETCSVGKNWGPGIAPGRDGHASSNVAGKSYNHRTREDARKTPYLYPRDYLAGMEQFMSERSADKPFCIWAGIFEPHSPWMRTTAAVAQAKSEFGVDVRSFTCDYYDHAQNSAKPQRQPPGYYYEMLHYDRTVKVMLDSLEQKGLLDNTMVIFIGDNGTFVRGENLSGFELNVSGNSQTPRSKASGYDAGVHVPFFLMWKDRTPGGRVVDDFVSAIDIGPTVLEAAGVPIPEGMSGRSMMGIINSTQSGQVDASRDTMMTGMEFHYENRLLPACRNIRSKRFEYIIHFENDGEEFYDLENDPWETNNLINNPEYQSEVKRLKEKMKEIGLEEGDPRFTGEMALFSHTHQYCNLRKESSSLDAWSKKFDRSYAEGLKAVGLPPVPKD
ncbi:sulfatase [Rhodopirellula sp. SWK7]|uniref:sulfatase family protein n=1 Tax=Rhodopirellula sp. SWK7 TaxID=595460 RepID=UPI0003474243|nr:sulfatase [Rhodopirellula sp. SWK7]